ncbi:MAG: helix-turn-helix transcriptional regulator [Escherichia coli]|nr:helix-turn-helix transcriptional regulator [Escherichia coli]MBL0989747.1 helix-turn-helix transcriptional regulator [Escherichia coli]MBL0999234.1 helix-turn-helix transcriptional regulator [Escherichia coli]
METKNEPKSKVNLRKLMKKLGMRTREFARATHLYDATLARYLRTDSITANQIYKIAMALDIDPRDMFFPTDEKEDENSLFTDDEEEQEKMKEEVSEEAAEAAEEEKQDAAPAQLQTTAFCPHCGAKVRVGVVLMQE